ncbi:MAG: FAD-dependent oxidoreductase [Scytonema sp. CRU_2_7]|nr:FAD-dependent oxidoreductase [Scytonema sp. CRU_2_7]
MTLDYDVVIIGGTLAGRYAALSASKLKAKVALVEPITMVRLTLLTHLMSLFITML